MSTPAEAAGREPNLDWVPGEWREERGGHVWHAGYWK